MAALNRGAGRAHGHECAQRPGLPGQASSDGPTLQGRSGLYDESHVERIELIRRLQEEGFNLDAARILIEAG